ncbi:MAG: ribosome biogenesis GTPase Der [Candidatus Gracilibacteria bacterium]|jgi:GTP-binding protein
MKAIVAIVGRPNTGKSTLFNRFVGHRRAIESDIPGTTRDRVFGEVSFENIPALLVDTGGLMFGKDEKGQSEESIEANVQEQSHIAISEADLILYVLDVRTEMTVDDFRAADTLRKSGKKVILVVNKCDNPHFEDMKYGFFELGFGEPVAVTALHSFGVDELCEIVAKELKCMGFKAEVQGDEAGVGAGTSKRRIKIAFLGRPNTGKSTMINGILGKKMLVVSDVPGTTRDSSNIDFEYGGRAFTLVDTAGIRRSGTVESGIEKFSVLRSIEAVSEVDVCVLLIDSEEGVTNQDCHISEYVLEEKKGLILAVNKMDLFRTEDSDSEKKVEERQHQLIHELGDKMAYVPWTPVVFTSGKRRTNLIPVLDNAIEVFDARNMQVDPSSLALWLDRATEKHQPTQGKDKKAPKVFSVIQDGTEPPTFVFKCNDPKTIHFTYQRYLENSLREAFGFTGTGIHLVFKGPKREDD